MNLSAQQLLQFINPACWFSYSSRRTIVLWLNIFNIRHGAQQKGWMCTHKPFVSEINIALVIRDVYRIRYKQLKTITIAIWTRNQEGSRVVALLRSSSIHSHMPPLLHQHNPRLHPSPTKMGEKKIGRYWNTVEKTLPRSTLQLQQRKKTN